jgi:hypothetical protein
MPRGEQPGGEQSLAAAKIKNASLVGDQSAFQQAEKHWVATELAACEVVGKAAGVAVALAGQIDETLTQGVGTEVHDAGY